MSKGWDSTTLKKLKALTGKGLSTAEIGKRLGMSKNAIVGKLNRLGWNSKAGGVDAKTPEKSPKPKSAPVKPVIKPVVDKKIKTTIVKKTPQAPKPVAKPVVSIKQEKTSDKSSSSKNLAMHQRIIQHSLEMANLKSDQCRWPIGNPDSEDFHFCGEKVFAGKPYCYEHCKGAYQFTPPKKK